MAKQVRIKIHKKLNKTNLKFLRYCTMKVKGKIVTNSAHEAIRITEARIVEY